MSKFVFHKFFRRLPGQDLDVISIPFHIYFIQVTTRKILTPEATIVQFLVWKPREFNLITGFITTEVIGSQGECLLFTQVDHH
jgi:hypothetical protein